MPRIDLTPIAAQPGVVSALMICGGQPMAAAGRHAGDAAILSVLVEAMVSAANELGVRTDGGECLEIASTHSAGGLILFASPTGSQIVIRCTPAIDLAEVRSMAHALLRSVPTSATPDSAPASVPSRSHVMPLADALNPSRP